MSHLIITAERGVRKKAQWDSRRSLHAPRL